MTEVTQAATPVVLTKEERLAKIDKEIKRLTDKRYNIENDIVATPAAKKQVALPEVGKDVLFTTGRTTATTNPVERIGVVVAVRPASVVNGKPIPAMIKVQVGSGFDAELVSIYPAQIQDAGPAAE